MTTNEGLSRFSFLVPKLKNSGIGKHQLVSIGMYAAIFLLLIFYKFNFIFPMNEKEFIFSGDFVRPITSESAMSYYSNVLVLNENTASIEVSAPIRILYWDTILIFTHLLSLNIVYWMLIICTHLSAALMITISAKNYFDLRKLHPFLSFAIPLIPAIFFLFSYPVNYRPYWLFLPLLPAFLFFLLALQLKMRGENGNIKTGQKFALIVTGYISILQPHLYLIITAGLITYILGAAIIAKITLKESLIAFLRKSYRPIFWFSIPAIVILIPLGILQSFYGIEIAPSYAYNFSVLQMTSENANIVNSLALSNGFWEKIVFNDFEKGLFVFMTLAVVALAGIFSRNKNKSPFFISAIAALCILLTLELGYNNPVYKIIGDPDFTFSWIFRDPFKISLAALGFVLFLITMSLSSIGERIVIHQKKFRIAISLTLIIPVIILTFIWTPQQKIEEVLKPSAIPEEYFTTTNFLNSQTQGPLLFIPDSGNKYTWAANSNLQSSILAPSYSGESLGPTITNNPYLREYIAYSAATHNTQLLKMISAGAIVDKSMIAPKYNDTIKEYLINENITRIGNDIHIIKNEDFARFSIYDTNPIAVLGSIDYAHVSTINNEGDRPVIFFDPIYDAIKNAKGSRILALKSDVGDGGHNWINGFAHDPLHGDWHYYLNRRNIDNWQSDYGKGIAFTWSRPEIPSTTIGSKTDTVNEWDFSTKSQVDEWTTMTPRTQSRAIQELKWENNSLKSFLWNSTDGWKQIRSPLIPTEMGHTYRLFMDIKAENASYVHVKLTEYDISGKAIASKTLKIVGTGTVDWKHVKYDYIDINPDVRTIQVQIWHGNNTTERLPNMVSIDSVRIQDLTGYSKPANLTVPFELKDEGSYKLFMRYMKNIEGGEVRISLDGTPITIYTKDQLNEFVWKDLGLFDLGGGKHELTVENLDGFNAINLLSIVPEKAYSNSILELPNRLDIDTVSYVYEGENDLHYEAGTILRDETASNNAVLNLQKGHSAWQEFEILRDDFYRVAVKGRGEFSLQTSNQSFIFEGNGKEFVYTPTMNLKGGKSSFSINALNNTQIDTIWLYSARNNETIEQVLGIDGKRILQYENIDATTWKLPEVNNRTPILLEFSKFYDPMWEARLYKNGQFLETVHPVPLFGVINGFKIDTLDVTEIVIRHKAQDLFEQFLPISMAGSIIVILYIVYDWRRLKGDSWAELLAKKHSYLMGIPKKFGTLLIEWMPTIVSRYLHGNHRRSSEFGAANTDEKRFSKSYLGKHSIEPSLVGIGNLAAGFIGGIFWLAFALITQVSDYGEANYYISLVSILSVMSIVGLNLAVMTFLPKGDERFRRQAGMIVVITNLMIAIPLIAITRSLPLALMLFGTSFFGMTIAEALGNKQYRKFPVLVIGQRAAQFVLAIALYFVLGIDGIIAGYGISALAFSYSFIKGQKHSLMSLFATSRTAWRESMDKSLDSKISAGLKTTMVIVRDLKPKLAFITHAYSVTIAQSLTLYADKLFIAPVFGFATLGLYQLGFQFLMFLGVIPASLIHYLLPQESSGANRAIVRKLGLAISVIIAAILFFTLGWIIGWLFPTYADAISAARIMILGIIPMTANALFNSRSLGREDGRPVIIGAGIYLGALFLLLYVLGTLFGINGLAAGVVASLSIQSVALLFMTRRSNTTNLTQQMTKK